MRTHREPTTPDRSNVAADQKRARSADLAHSWNWAISVILSDRYRCRYLIAVPSADVASLSRRWAELRWHRIAVMSSSVWFLLTRWGLATRRIAAVETPQARRGTAGFVTEAKNRGIDEADIMRHTRHKSVQIMRRYDRTSGLWIRNATTGVSL